MPAKEKFTAIYEQLKDHITQVVQGSLKNEKLHLTMTKAAFIKCFEFNLFISQQDSPEYAFFVSTNLRGSCEDLIVLKYLKECLDEEDVQDFLLLSIAENFQKGIQSQVEFFNTYRSLQPIIKNFELFAKDENKRRTQQNHLKNKYGWKKTTPTVKAMAEACDLKALYDYLYAATSKSVHFNPQVLLRMGWGDGNDAEYKYSNSVSHFGGYHADFSRFYGSFLLIKFVDSFSQHLNLSVKFIELTKQLKELIDRENRWPEIVTFEEMNIPKPSIIDYALSAMMENLKNDKLPEA